MMEPNLDTSLDTQCCKTIQSKTIWTMIGLSKPSKSPSKPPMQLVTTVPHDNDVLCGRGGIVAAHPGQAMSSIAILSIAKSILTSLQGAGARSVLYRPRLWMKYATSTRPVGSY